MGINGINRQKNYNFKTFNGYEENKQVLHDVSVYAEPGQKVAFVGATGAGKTTITNLLNRFYDIDSGSITIFTGILIFIGCWLIVSQVLEMRLLGSIFDKLVSVGVLALIVLFQDEIRKFLVTLGSHKKLGSFFRFLTKNKKEKTEQSDIMPIVMACMNMAKRKEGALIVIEQADKLGEVIKTGETVNADINQNAPLIVGIKSTTSASNEEITA